MSLTQQLVERYEQDGYLHLSGLLNEDEMAAIEGPYQELLSGRVPSVGKDLSDIDGKLGKPMESFSAVSVLLPGKYLGELAEDANVYVQRAKAVAAKLLGRPVEEVGLDLDRIIAKKPNRPDAEFHWHQDDLYCTMHGVELELPEKDLVTVCLALDDTTPENGCISFVPGSHRGPLREHKPVFPDRCESESTGMKISKVELGPEDAQRAVLVPIRRGDVTIHTGRTLHSSGGNKTDGWRRTYLLQFRPVSAIEFQRKAGYVKSLNFPRDVAGMVAPQHLQKVSA